MLMMMCITQIIALNEKPRRILDSKLRKKSQISTEITNVYSLRARKTVECVLNASIRGREREKASRKRHPKDNVKSNIQC